MVHSGARPHDGRELGVGRGPRLDEPDASLVHQDDQPGHQGDSKLLADVAGRRDSHREHELNQRHEVGRRSAGCQALRDEPTGLPDLGATQHQLVEELREIEGEEQDDSAQQVGHVAKHGQVHPGVLCGRLALSDPLRVRVALHVAHGPG